jgi:hypothetical protein
MKQRTYAQQQFLKGLSPRFRAICCQRAQTERRCSARYMLSTRYYVNYDYIIPSGPVKPYNRRGPVTPPIQQADFDTWHRGTCEKLIAVYGGTFPFHAGQAQKWINMTLKYVYTIGEGRIPGFAPAYPLCHAPLDNDVLTRLTQYGFEWPSKAWSRLDYDEYLKCQEWIRDKFKPTPPLSIEFFLWMGV